MHFSFFSVEAVRSCLSGLGSFTVEDIKRIGILDSVTLGKDNNTKIQMHEVNEEKDGFLVFF